MVSTHLKSISQTGSSPRVGVNIKHFWNHHLVWNFSWLMFLCKINQLHQQLGFKQIIGILLSWHIIIPIYNWVVNYSSPANTPTPPHLLTDGWGEGEAPIGISRDAGIVPGLWTVMGAGEAICGTGGGAAAIRGMVGCGKGCETSVKGTPVKQHTVDGQKSQGQPLGMHK